MVLLVSCFWLPFRPMGPATPGRPGRPGSPWDHVKPNVNALKCKFPVNHLNVFSSFVSYLSIQNQVVQPLQGSPSVHLYPSGLLVPLDLVPLPRKKRITIQFQFFFHVNWENNKADAPVLPFGPLGPANPGWPICPGGPSHTRNIIKCYCVGMKRFYLL